mgnify:CR=1 FL=1
MLGNTLESPVNSSYRHSAASATNAVGTTAEGKAYTANNLNQYTAIDDFTPQYDADGNQTLIKTETGIWSVLYNAENRPIRWQSGDTVITMAFDRMGRRVEMGTVKDGAETLQRFVYDNYLCVQQLRGADNTLFHSYVWDPTNPSPHVLLSFSQHQAKSPTTSTTATKTSPTSFPPPVHPSTTPTRPSESP